MPNNDDLKDFVQRGTNAQEAVNREIEKAAPKQRVDTGNYQGVSMQFAGTPGERLMIMAPRVHMSKHEAILHAAWLVALADPERETFDRVLEAVLNI